MWVKMLKSIIIAEHEHAPLLSMRSSGSKGHHSLSTVMQVEYASGPNLGMRALRLQ
jgi:hypothetical protein